MQRWIAGACSAIALFAAAQPAAAFLFVSGSNGRSGDLIAVWVKNGFELILNLGAVDQIGLGTVATFEVPAEFDGSLAGAKFTALAVPNPDAVFAGLGFDPPLIQNNIALTTLGDPLAITYNQVADAQSVLDSPVSAQTNWFVLLGSIPAAGQTGVVSNTDTEALIQTTLFASYTGNVGFTSDSIGGRIPLSTAVSIAIGQPDRPYSIPLYEVFQTVVLSNADFVVGTDVMQRGVLTGDDGISGNAILSLATPEPDSLALGGAVVATLAWVARRRR